MDDSRHAATVDFASRSNAVSEVAPLKAALHLTGSSSADGSSSGSRTLTIGSAGAENIIAGPASSQSSSKASACKTVGGYKKIKDLGVGSFGKAILVENKDSGQRCVMKAIDITRLGERQREQSINEVKLLGSMKHPFIIAYRESFIVNGFLCIITDFADGGDLYAAIKARRELGRPFPEKQILRWLIQCALALKHLHARHILHRDVKSQNIFLNSTGRIRLGDFGIAKALDTTGSFAKTIIGTPYYLSPEICKSQPYSWASDIWSLGCVLYELCALRVPFEAPNMRALASRIVDGRPPLLPLHYSAPLRSLYTKMLAKNPHDRPTATEVLRDPLLQRECALMLGGGEEAGVLREEVEEARIRMDQFEAGKPERGKSTVEKNTLNASLPAQMKERLMIVPPPPTHKPTTSLPQKLFHLKAFRWAGRAFKSGRRSQRPMPT